MPWRQTGDLHQRRSTQGSGRIETTWSRLEQVVLHPFQSILKLASWRTDQNRINKPCHCRFQSQCAPFGMGRRQVHLSVHWWCSCWISAFINVHQSPLWALATIMFGWVWRSLMRLIGQRHRDSGTKWKRVVLGLVEDHAIPVKDTPVFGGKGQTWFLLLLDHESQTLSILEVWNWCKVWTRFVDTT